MLTLISFIILMIGAINWFCIGLLQFDFIAGLFGSQSSIFSRLIYFTVGLAALVVLYNLSKNRGRIVFDFKDKKQTTNDLKVAGENQAEAGKEFTSENDINAMKDYASGKNMEVSQDFTSRHKNKTNRMDMEAGKEFTPNDNPQMPPELTDDHEDDDFCHECNKSDNHKTQADHYETNHSNPLPKPSNNPPKPNHPSGKPSTRLPLNKKWMYLDSFDFNLEL